MDTKPTRKRRPRRIREAEKLTIEDIIPDARGPLVRWIFHQQDLEQMERMASIGMTNHQLSFLFGCHPRQFDRFLAEDKKNLEDGDTSQWNLYGALERGRSSGALKIVKTAFQVAVEDKNVQMLIWLTKVKLGWREHIDISSDIKQTIVYETQISGGTLRQTANELGSGEVEVLDAIIEDITEDVCPSNESESKSEPLPTATNKD